MICENNNFSITDSEGWQYCRGVKISSHTGMVASTSPIVIDSALSSSENDQSQLIVLKYTSPYANTTHVSRTTI